MLAKTPGFTAVAVLTVAVGVGANVAIFSYVDELWLRPMPVPHSDRLVRIFTSNPSSNGEIERGYNSYPDFEYLRQNSKTLSGIALIQGRGAMFDDGTQNRLVTSAVISDNFFDVLRPVAAAGRLFSEAELRSEHAPVVVLSYPFWQRQFNGDPSIAGRTIVVDRKHVTVLGVLPRSFRGNEAMLVRDLWIPMSTWQQLIGKEKSLTACDFRDYSLFGRLADGVTLPQAKAELANIGRQLEIAYPASNTGRKLTVLPEIKTRGNMIASFGLILLSVAGLVLLIACSNVASLLIARAEYRRPEIAARIALGASRARIILQLLTETAILALVGGLAALLAGRVLLNALPSLMPQTSIAVGVDAYLSSRGLAAAFLLTLLAMLIFGLAPAFLASQTAPASAFRQHGVEAGRIKSKFRHSLVVLQVAISLVLVVGAGLLIHSVWHALRLDPGFDAHQKMLVIDFTPSTDKSQDDMDFVREAQRRIEALPGSGVSTVAMRIPFGISGAGATHKIFVPGSLADAHGEGATINFDPVGNKFFDVLGTRILRGRPIEQHDLETGARVVVVNQQMADRFWPNDDPIGKRFRLERADGDEYVVVGLAENGKYNDFEENPIPYFFMPMKIDDYGELVMAVKTSANPETLFTPVRQMLRSLNGNVAILRMVTLREHMREALYGERVAAGLIGSLGGLALLLAAIGIYGLMSFLVGRRTREIGIRLALGADRVRIFRMVVSRALLLGMIGVVIGTFSAILATRALRSLLVDVGPFDLISFTIGIAALLGVAIVAALRPAVQATRVDPIQALRCE